MSISPLRIRLSRAVIAVACLLVGAVPATAEPTVAETPVAGFRTLCSAPAGGGWKVEWLWRGRVVARGATFRPTDGYVGEQIACRATKGARVRVSPLTRVIAPPNVGGLPLIGRVVSCNVGRGVRASRVPRGAAFQWRRGTRVIPRASARRYRLRPTDVGRNLSCSFLLDGRRLRSRGTPIWGPPRLTGSGRAGSTMRCVPTWPKSGIVSVRWRIATGSATRWWTQPDVYGRDYPISPAEPGGRIGCDMRIELDGNRVLRTSSTPATLRAGWRAPSMEGAFSALVFADAIPARATPGGGRRVGVLRGQSELLGGEKRVVVTDLRRHHGRVWAKVLLSSRPNGLQGWVPDEYLTLRFNPMRIVVDQSDRTLAIYRRGRLVSLMTAGVGKPATPTPNGLFGVESHIPTPNEGVYGPMVLVLTGHSPVLYNFDGGDGRLAIHGTNARSSVGRAESFGCIRLGNRNVLRVARLVPDGTLMEIKA